MLVPGSYKSVRSQIGCSGRRANKTWCGKDAERINMDKCDGASTVCIEQAIQESSMSERDRVSFVKLVWKLTMEFGRNLPGS
jgi:hypothetical protein